MTGQTNYNDVERRESPGIASNLQGFQVRDTGRVGSDYADWWYGGCTGDLALKRVIGWSASHTVEASGTTVQGPRSITESHANISTRCSKYTCIFLVLYPGYLLPMYHYYTLFPFYESTRIPPAFISSSEAIQVASSCMHVLV